MEAIVFSKFRPLLCTVQPMKTHYKICQMLHRLHSTVLIALERFDWCHLMIVYTNSLSQPHPLNFEFLSSTEGSNSFAHIVG